MCENKNCILITFENIALSGVVLFEPLSTLLNCDVLWMTNICITSIALFSKETHIHCYLLNDIPSVMDPKIYG